MMSRQRVEILSPAGDREKLEAAVAFGADAVYMAGKSLGLRAGSANFSRDEMADAISWAHSRGVRCYITMNILAHEDDFRGLEEEILFLHDAGADALIVSDPGIFSTIRSVCPDMEIHISTQANVTNAKTCRFWYELGAKRIVLARELTLREIFAIRRDIPPDLELECFVHGAMCVSYSGRCLLSNLFTGRNANHGECAQPCRWRYYVTEEKRPDMNLPIEEDDRGTYIFNSKDICMIDHIPELIEAGITSFKIEGRIKGAFYAAATTKAYREAVDAYYRDPATYSTDPYLRELLERTVHRVFDTGFFFDSPREDSKIFSENTYIRPAFVAGVVIGYDPARQAAIVSQRNKINIGDELHVLAPKTRPDIIRATGLLDKDLQSIASTPRAMMLYYLPVPYELEKNSYLIRIGDKDTPGKSAT